MELSSVLQKDYSIDPIKIERTQHGSSRTYLVETMSTKYIVKFQERDDFVSIYDKVEKILNKHKILQSRIIKTNDGLLMNNQQLVVYQFIEGKTYKLLNETRIENALNYMRKYNEILNLVPFKKNMIQEKNHWDKANSIDYIINVFPSIILDLELEHKYKEIIIKAINLLKTNYEYLSKKKRLVHTDLGPDNFIFQNDEIISIIDFTPGFHHELYSLCQFVYWNELYNGNRISKKRLNDFLSMYNTDGNDEHIFYLLLVQASLFRIIGPILDKRKKECNQFEDLAKRFLILDNLLSI